MVEFALVLPLLLLLLLGMTSFGFMLNYSIDETQLTREVARYAAVNFNPGKGETPSVTLQEFIRRQADTKELREGNPPTVPARAQLCISFPTNATTGTSGQVGDPVRAEMSVTYKLLPFLGDRINVLNVAIKRHATMRLEAKPTEYAAGCTT